MANQEHLDILAKGVKEWNDWREANPDDRPNLSRANFRGADLSYARLQGADLTRAHFEEAQLVRADFTRADLTRANLSNALVRNVVAENARLSEADFTMSDVSHSNLRNATFNGTDFSGADLRGVILAGAELRGARLLHTDLIDADLARADLTGAMLDRTCFGNVDLSEVIGLATVVHVAPSIIGVDTIYRSKGKIPEAFLRGVGLPDNFIAYMHSLTGAAFEFYSCFISYSTKDQAFADRLHADLQARGVRCWFAPHDIQGGRKIHEQIDEAIRLYDKLLLVLSEASMTSNWVKTEIANARAREEQQKRQMLFPITIAPFERIKSWKLFDGDQGIDTAREIREYFIPDFSDWKAHDCYQHAFDRLLRDLKAEGKERP